jgi:N-acetylmuramoyl-L-alanine amidase
MPDPNGRSIVIDPGHGGRDNGAVANGVKEKDITLTYSVALQADLLRRGHEVYLTRAHDKDLSTNRDWRKGKGEDLLARSNLANRVDADCFISIHANAGASTASNGAWVLYSKGSANGQRLAAAIFKELAKIQGIADADPEAEVYSDDSGWTGGRTLSVLRRTRMPAALVELGFLTNPGDTAQLMSEATRKPVVVAIANGIESWLKTI